MAEACDFISRRFSAMRVAAVPLSLRVVAGPRLRDVRAPWLLHAEQAALALLGPRHLSPNLRSAFGMMLNLFVNLQASHAALGLVVNDGYGGGGFSGGCSCCSAMMAGKITG